MSNHYETRIAQVLGNECSVSDNQSFDLSFIVDEQLRSDGFVRAIGSSLDAVMH